MTDIDDRIEILRNKIESYRALRDDLGEEAEHKISELERQIETLGGAYVEGNVDIQNGDFVGHDKIIIQQAMISITQQMMNANPKLDRAALEAATAAYLQYIHDRHTSLTMKGIGPAESLSLRLALLDLYVPLMARREAPEGETRGREARLAGRSPAAALRLGAPQALLEILRENDGLVILGDPGAGKTTFLKFLALKLARGEGGELGLEGRLPLLLPLAAYANALQENNPRLDRFIADYFDEIIGGLPFGPMLAEALAAGKALILLDGLDEVKDPSLRNTVAERVTDFYAAQRRKGNKFVLTSRVVGYHAARLAAEGLVECALLDFDADEIGEFVARWTVAIEKQALGDSLVARRDAEAERRELLEAIRANAGVRQLAANPLLLTILALMKRKGVTLPERRVQLYEQYVRTLVSAWNRARSLSGRPPGRDLDDVQAVRVLAPLALWMRRVAPGVGLVRRVDLQRKLEDIFRERSAPDPESAARQFLDDMREHTALLLERGLDEYGFIHLTLEEYLAAAALGLAAQGNAQVVLDELLPRIGEPAWREVCLLAVSYIGIVQNLPRVAGRIVEGLAQASTGAPAEAQVLAGEAALDAWPDGVTRESAEKVVASLIPAMQNDAAAPDLRRRAGLALGRLGWLPADLDEFVEIPPGKFIGGDHQKEYAVEAPYQIAKYPLTNAQFGRFVRAGGYGNPDWWSQAGWDWRMNQYPTQASEPHEKRLLEQRPAARRDRPFYWDRLEWNNPITPVVGVSWFEAEAYCNWLTQEPASLEIPPGYVVRLPNEDEWEKAARSTDGREYPWGDELSFARANVAQEIARGAGTSAVCAYPLGVSPAGVWDMSGNVWEWTASWFQPGKTRALHGGAWSHDQTSARCAARLRNFPDLFDDNIGFRCVIAPPLEA